MLEIKTTSTIDMLLGNKNDALKIRHRIEEMLRKNPATFRKVAKILMMDGDIRWDDLGQETIESTKSSGLFSKEQHEKIFGKLWSSELILEDGKTYIDREGNQVQVFEKFPCGAYPFEGDKIFNDIRPRYTRNGKIIEGDDAPEFPQDLVKEA